MLKGLFRDQFVTCEIGFKKSEPTFYEEIIRQLQVEQPSLTPGKIVFFDDSQDKS